MEHVHRFKVGRRVKRENGLVVGRCGCGLSARVGAGFPVDFWYRGRFWRMVGPVVAWVIAVGEAMDEFAHPF